MGSMATDEIKPGDVVMLKSGSPRMTVTGIIEYENSEAAAECACQWFCGDRFQHERFLPLALEKVPPES